MLGCLLLACPNLVVDANCRNESVTAVYVGVDDLESPTVSGEAVLGSRSRKVQAEAVLAATLGRAFPLRGRHGIGYELVGHTSPMSQAHWAKMNTACTSSLLNSYGPCVLYSCPFVSFTITYCRRKQPQMSKEFIPSPLAWQGHRQRRSVKSICTRSCIPLPVI
ncbi:hypothetical protein V8F20_005454 [Naviculisporaceae sp. PSN 640]